MGWHTECIGKQKIKVLAPSAKVVGTIVEYQIFQRCSDENYSIVDALSQEDYPREIIDMFACALQGDKGRIARWRKGDAERIGAGW